MPKVSTYTLLWLHKQGRYELREQDQALPVSLADETWPAWLTAHAAFAFQGQQGRLTLSKESRERGSQGYWYAYRSQNGYTRKRYLGRSQHLTIARLEEAASALQGATSQKQERMRTGADSSSGPLLVPKLHAPSLRPALIPRERLLARLDACLTGKLTLISAPAGFGKTTLVCQWIADRGTRADAPGIAWVALDAGDNDPARFWRYVIAACQPLLADRGQTALAHLQTISQPSPFESPSLETTLTIFLNELSQSARRGLLVLEDYHVISEPRLYETLTFLLDHLPPTLRLVIISRSDPALSLARLRASNELNELRTTELRFSRQEMADFLRQTVSLPVSAEMLNRLADRLEGWAAGLRLVSLALQRQSTTQEIERFLSSLAGNHRSLLEYFITEVLAIQPPEIQSFLLSTSAFNRLTGPLCDALTRRDDAAQILDTLARANLFLEPLDETGRWYRYHALFAESMQHEAKRRLGEEHLRLLNGRASEWYEQAGLLAEAVETALRARDTERAANLVEHIYETATQQENLNGLHTLYRWMQQLPETALLQRPSLCLKYAVVVLFVAISGPLTPSVVAQFERLFQTVERHAEARQNMSWSGQILALRSMLAWRQGEIGLAEQCASRALAILPLCDIQMRGAALSVLARLEMLSGRFDAARKKFLEARILCATVGNRTLTRAMTGMLSGVCTEQGELRQADAYLQQMLSQARTTADIDDVAHGQLGRARLLYEWNDLDGAYSAASETLEIGEQLSQEEHVSRATLLLARIDHARGRSSEAQQRLTAFLASLSPLRTSLTNREALTFLVRFQLASGDFASVQRWADTRPDDDSILPVTQIEREELLLARLWLAQGEADQALEHLWHLLKQAREAQRTRSLLEILTLIALAQHALQRPEEASKTLQETLRLARPEGFLRLFLDEGQTMAALLRAVLLHTREKALLTYTQQILQAFAREPGGATNALPPNAALLNEPLSAQERRVLRLLACGRSNPQIARELIVSVNTVRSQVQSIYRKLNVNNRVAASEIAHDLQLL